MHGSAAGTYAGVVVLHLVPVPLPKGARPAHGGDSGRVRHAPAGIGDWLPRRRGSVLLVLSWSPQRPQPSARCGRRVDGSSPPESRAAESLSRETGTMAVRGGGAVLYLSLSGRCLPRGGLGGPLPLWECLANSGSRPFFPVALAVIFVCFSGMTSDICHLHPRREGQNPHQPQFSGGRPPRRAGRLQSPRHRRGRGRHRYPLCARPQGHRQL